MIFSFINIQFLTLNNDTSLNSQIEIELVLGDKILNQEKEKLKNDI